MVNRVFGATEPRGVGVILRDFIRFHPTLKLLQVTPCISPTKAKRVDK